MPQVKTDVMEVVFKGWPVSDLLREAASWLEGRNEYVSGVRLEFNEYGEYELTITMDSD